MSPRKLSQWLYNFINLQCDKDGLLWSPYFSSTHTTLSSFCSWREAFIVFFGPFYLWKFFSIMIYSVQFTYLVMSDSLQSHKSQNTRLSITSSWSLLKLMSTESVMPSNYLILCLPLLPPSIFLSLRVFSNESALHIRWPRCRSISSASVLTMSVQGWFPVRKTVLISLKPKGLSRVFPNTTVQKCQFFSAQLSSQSNSHIHTWPLEKP